MIKKLTLLVSLALLPFATLSAKSKANFSGWEGSYTGTNLVTVSNSTQSSSGIALIQVTVPRNGRSAVATIFGGVSGGSSLSPISGTLTMRKSTLSGSDVLFGALSRFPGSSASPFTIPGKLFKSGFRALGSGTVTFPTLEPIPVFIQCTVKVHPQGKKKKKIIIFYVLTTDSGTQTYVFTATAKVTEK